MKALVFHGDNDMSYEDVETPVCSAGQVLVKVKAVGICGSDVHGYLGKTGRRIPPMVMGHEFAGQVAAVGNEVSDVSPGDRVIVFPYSTCGDCASCMSGSMNSCAQKEFFGVFTNNGGMAEYVVAKPDMLYALPATVGYIHGALAEPLSVSARCVETARISPGCSVTVIGVGTIGLMCLMLAKLQGASTLIAVDISEERLAIARNLGATHIINPRNLDAEAYVQQHIKAGGTDIVIEAVGIESTLQQAVKLAARGGRIAVVGMSQRMITVDMHELISKELSLDTSFLYDRQQFEYIIRSLPALRESLDCIVSLTAPLAYGAEIYRRLAGGESGLVKVVLTD